MNIEYTIRDSELLYLGQYLYDMGYKVQLLDYYASSSSSLISKLENFSPDILIVHLWKTELLMDSLLPKILDHLSDIKLRFKIPILSIGSISALLFEDIFNYNNSVDVVVADKGIFYKCNKLAENQKDFCEEIQIYFKKFIKLTKEYLSNNVNYFSEDIAGLSSSRGCLRKCSFCAYNSDLRYGWQAKEIETLVEDVKLINSVFKITQIALSDSNFGANITTNEIRSSDLAKSISNLDFKIQISLSFSSEGLSKFILDNLKIASVKFILIGLESLIPETLKLFNKNQDISKTVAMIDYAESIGIIPIISYILFHPWLSINTLKQEILAIEQFGRYRIPHFLARSILSVVPGTAIEQKLHNENLLIKEQFSRRFIFKDKSVENIYNKLSKFFTENYILYNYDISSLSELKIREWKYLKYLVDCEKYD